MVIVIKSGKILDFGLLYYVLLEFVRSPKKNLGQQRAPPNPGNSRGLMTLMPIFF